MNFAWALPPIIAAASTATDLPDAGFSFRSWSIYFLLTLTLEVPITLAVWRFRGCNGPLRPWLLACVIGNLVSHPTASWIGGLVGLPSRGFDAFASYTLLETGVIALEAWAYRIRATSSWTEAVIMAFAANAVTAVLGAYIMFLM